MSDISECGIDQPRQSIHPRSAKSIKNATHQDGAVTVNRPHLDPVRNPAEVPAALQAMSHADEHPRGIDAPIRRRVLQDRRSQPQRFSSRHQFAQTPSVRAPLGSDDVGDELPAACAPSLLRRDPCRENGGPSETCRRSALRRALRHPTQHRNRTARVESGGHPCMTQRRRHVRKQRASLLCGPFEEKMLLYSL